MKSCKQTGTTGRHFSAKQNKEALLFVARVTCHGDQKLAELNDQIVLVGLELPANALSCWGSEVASERLQALSDLLILREDRAEVGERRGHLGPDTV